MEATPGVPDPPNSPLGSIVGEDEVQYDPNIYVGSAESLHVLDSCFTDRRIRCVWQPGLEQI
eukprot:942281-Karenia_brevis.AAC.1